VTARLSITCLLFVTILVSGCLGAQIVPSDRNMPSATPSSSDASTQAPYPPTDKPYLDKDVNIKVDVVDANTIAVTNAGGTDASSLAHLWLNVNMRGYITPASGMVTSQVGSTAYYSVSKDSYVTITGEFPDCNSILWNGYTSTVTPAPTQAYSPAIAPTHAPAQSNDYYTRTYKWSYKNRQYTWTLTISKDSYDFYKGRPHNRQSNYAMYAMSDYDRTYLRSLVDKLTEASVRDGFSEYDSVKMVIAFVQSLPYTSDSVTTGYDEYPRYPIETLVDDGGDCEDTSILTAALLNEMGYGVILISPTGHMAVGIKGGDNVYGTYWTYEGSKYFYVETTGEGYDIGQLPREYAQATAKIYPMLQLPDFDISFTTTYESLDFNYVYYKVHCDVSNIGTGIAENVNVYMAALALTQGTDRVWPPDHTIAIGDISEGGTAWAEATIRVPRGETSQIECVVYGDNFASEVAMTKTFET
jgi:predicted transglutaminase-like cysteine proteinase